MMRRMRGDDGAAAVEFALVLPVLILILCGIIDFGRFYNARITLSHAAHEAVRVWALGGTATEVTARAEATATGLDDVAASPTTCTFGDPTTVTVTATFSFIFPLVTEMPGDLTELSEDGVMRCGG